MVAVCFAAALLGDAARDGESGGVIEGV